MRIAEIVVPVTSGESRHRGQDASVQLIVDQLGEERSLKASIEQRAIGVITTSGTLVTLLLAVSALVTRDADFVIPAAAAIAASAAIGSFVITAIVAIFALMPRSYGVVTAEDLRRLVSDDTWESASEYAAQDAARLRVEVTDAARRTNRVKARILGVALACQVIAVLCLATAAIVLLAERY